MKELRSLKAMCRPDWYAKAYSEYLKDVNDQFGKLIVYFQECLNIDDTILANINANNIDTDIYDIVDIIWNNFSVEHTPEFIQNARISLPSIGYVSINDLAFGLIKYIYQADDVDATMDIQIGLTGKTISYQVFSSHFVGSNANATALQVAFETLSTIPLAQASEKVDLFINKINGTIDIYNDTGRDVLNYYKELLFNNSTVEEFTSAIDVVSGLAGTAEQDGNIVSTEFYDQCDMSKYTGSTPGIALDFTGAMKVVSTVVNVGAKVASGIMKSVFKLRDWLFKKIDVAITTNVIDPQIAEYVKPTTNLGLFDGFAFNDVLVTNENNVPSYCRNDLFNIVNIFSQFNHYDGNWIKLETRIGELLFKPEALSSVEPVGYSSMYWKPIAIDVDYLLANVSSWTDINNANATSVNDFLQNTLSWIESIAEFIVPLSENASKYQLVRGVVFANQMLAFLSKVTLLEAYVSLFDASQLQISEIGSIRNNFSSVSVNINEESNVASQITNNKLIQLIAGPIGESDVLGSYPSYNSLGVNQIVSSSNVSDTIGYSIRLLMLTWMLSRYDRSVHPTDYIFIPFSNNTLSFSAPSWRVKSDQEIAETRDNFIEAAITVTVIAALVITTGVIINRIKRNTFFKRKQFLDKMEAKSWAGEPLTQEEKTTYIRYARKQQASNLLDPFFSSASSTANIDPNAREYDGILRRIKNLILYEE